MPTLIELKRLVETKRPRHSSRGQSIMDYDGISRAHKSTFDPK
jgi:hypothetical protein